MFDRLKENVRDFFFEPRVKQKDFLIINGDGNLFVGTETFNARTCEPKSFSAVNVSHFGRTGPYLEEAAKELDIPTDELRERLLENKRQGDRNHVIYYRSH